MRWLLNIAAVLFLLIGAYALMGPNSSAMMRNVFQGIYAGGGITDKVIFDYIHFIMGMIFLSFSLTWIVMAYMLKKMLMIRRATYDNPKVYDGVERRAGMDRRSVVSSNADIGEK